MVSYIVSFNLRLSNWTQQTKQVYHVRRQGVWWTRVAMGVIKIIVYISEIPKTNH